MPARLKPYWRVFLASLREDVANPKRLVVAVLQQIGRVLLVVAIYRVAYEFSPNHTLTFTNAMWTIGLCFAFFINLGMRNIYVPIELEIKSGVVETGLIKPLDWRLVKFCEHLGRCVIEFGLQLVVLPILLLILVGPPDVAHLTPLSLLLFIPFVVMSITTAACLFTMVGMAAFWLNDAKSVFRIVDKLALVFCGTFVPLALLPQFVQTLTFFLPFNIYAAPTRLFDPTLAPALIPTFASGLVWVGIMLAACQFMWRRATVKMEVNGG